jgi:penicillin amidase
MLEQGLGFNIGPARFGGSGTTVNVAHYGLNFPTRTRGGASQRHVVDMGDVELNGGFILPSGQSGLPFDKHYRDQFELWLTGGLWRIPLQAANVEAAAEYRMALEPERP